MCQIPSKEKEGRSWSLGSYYALLYCLYPWPACFVACRTEVPTLRYLVPDGLRWSWCYNNRNKVHSKYNVLKSSPNHSPCLPSPWKNCLPQNQSRVPETLGNTAVEYCSGADFQEYLQTTPLSRSYALSLCKGGSCNMDGGWQLRTCSHQFLHLLVSGLVSEMQVLWLSTPVWAVASPLGVGFFITGEMGNMMPVLKAGWLVVPDFVLGVRVMLYIHSLIYSP